MQTNSVDASVPPCDLLEARSRFGLLLGTVYRQWRRQVDVHFKDLVLSEALRSPLLALYVEEQPLRQKDLADALSLDTSSLVRVLAQLREAGLVDWATHPADRRTKCIRLTDAGREAAGLILAKSMEIESTILADLTPQELEVTRRALEKIVRRFETLGR